MTDDANPSPLDANRALWDRWAELHAADETHFRLAVHSDSLPLTFSLRAARTA